MGLTHRKCRKSHIFHCWKSLTGNGGLAASNSFWNLFDRTRVKASFFFINASKTAAVVYDACAYLNEQHQHIRLNSYTTLPGLSLTIVKNVSKIYVVSSLASRHSGNVKSSMWISQNPGKEPRGGKNKIFNEKKAFNGKKEEMWLMSL